MSVSYSKYIKYLSGVMKSKDWWPLIADKKLNKEMVQSLGVPVPKYYNLPHDVVIKPKSSHSSMNVNIFNDYKKWIMEELLVDEDGGNVIRDFRWYFFGEKAKMIQISRENDGIKYEYYYSWPDWKLLNIDDVRPSFDVEKPKCIELMHDYAQKIASQFNTPIRVDMYAALNGPVFGELCVTAGLVMGNRINEDGDKLLGSWLKEYRENKNEKN